MSAKKWLMMLAGAVALALAVCAGANVLTDPFGVFGDPVFHWYSYNETNNPRMAKLAWLEEHHGEYDSYIIGSSSAASLETAALEKYVDGRFYNLFVYGSDTRDYRDLAAYVLEHYEVRRLVVNLGINEANVYGSRPERINDRMHALASGENPALFYLRCAFANPRYALDKALAWGKDTELPQTFDVFDVSSGCYDKRVRNVEKVGDPAAYAAANPGAFYMEPDEDALPCIAECVRSVAEIRDMCEEKGAELLVICSPVSEAQWNLYDEETLRAYRTALAQEVDYWDFGCTPLTYDTRYFYDATHFRTTAGDMVLAEIFDDPAVYRPERFGAYVTKENCQAWLDEIFSDPPRLEESAYTADVPILMYHHFTDAPAQDTEVSPETFAAHMETLAREGYHAVSFQEMIDYVYYGAPLPDRPVCITMDDGYLSSYEIACPILRQYGMKATVFAIGSSVGHTERYKDTEFPITPHFSWEQAREMAGVIDFQSHTFDLHQWAPYETGDRVRASILPLDGENEADWAAAVRADLAEYDRLRRQELGEGFCALAYPGGYYDEAAEVLVHQAGIPVTVSIRTDSRNVLVRGVPQSLYALCRWNVTERTTAEELLQILEP